MADVAYSPQALDDLTGVKAYIANELKNEDAANRTVTAIMARIGSLKSMPRIGAPLSTVIDIDTDYRFLVSGNYLAFYRYIESDDICYIDRVLYKRRDYMNVLFVTHSL